MGVLPCKCVGIPDISGIIQRIAENPDVLKLIASIGEKVDDFNKTFVEETKKVKEELEKSFKSRHDQLAKLKKSKEGITEEKIKELNKKELEKEIDVLSNEVDKMHYIFDLGLECVDVLRSITLNEFKANDVPSTIIDEINKYTVVEFLKSTYGKVLQDALVKKGLDETLLSGVKNEIMNNRGERRKSEREEFGIKINEFENENINELKLNLMELIEGEYKDVDKNFKGYARDKMIESMFP
jgi:hypothetical protein